MPAAFPPDSVGLVVPQVAHFSEPLALACGRSLPAYDLIYETYGQLNATASNAVLICHALSGHHHAAGSTVPTSASPAGGTAASAPASPSTPTNSLWSA